jgi:hypothetical protein
MVRALPTPPSGHPSLGGDGEQIHFSNSFPLLERAGVGYSSGLRFFHLGVRLAPTGLSLMA